VRGEREDCVRAPGKQARHKDASMLCCKKKKDNHPTLEQTKGVRVVSLRWLLLGGGSSEELT